MSAVTTAFTVVSCGTFLIVAIPFPWHLQAWNSGACMYMAWTSLGCLNLFVNSIIWRGNMANLAPVWCDISTKFMVGVNVALPAASLCINRRLYQIASLQTVTTTKADKVGGVMIDLLIGVGLPVLFMIIHYIVQGHRFDIFEDYGCMPFSYNTPITYVIVHGPIMALGIASAVYATLNVIRLNHRTDELRLLISSNASLNLNRYLRPIFLACIVIVLSVSLCVLDMTISALGDVKPYISWEHVHSDFSRIDQYPADVWRGTPTSNFQLEQARWGTLAYGLVFFALFGFAREARERYVRAFWAVAQFFGMHAGDKMARTTGSQGRHRSRFTIGNFGPRSSMANTHQHVKQQDSMDLTSCSSRFQEEDGRRTDDSTAFSTFVLGDACSEISTIHFHEIEGLLPIISNTSATPQQQVQKPNPGQAISIPSATESSITAAVSVSASPPYRAAPQAQLPTSATTSSESMYSTSTGPDPGPGESTPIPIPPFSRQAQAQTPRSHTGRDLQIATAPPRLIPRLPAPPPAGRTPGTSLRPRIQDRAPPAGPRRVVASTTHNSFLDLSDSPPSTPPVTLTRPQ